MFRRVHRYFACLSLFQRIAIGNSLIIVFGAVAGTLITRHLAWLAADIWLILAFAGAGTVLAVAINGLLVRAALRPLAELRGLLDPLQVDQVEIAGDWLTQADHDVRRLARALQSLVLQLERRNLELKALSERAIAVQEEERKRIARHLHDGMGQTLSTLIIALDRLESQVPAEWETLHGNLLSGRCLAEQTLRELRKTIAGLRPAILDDLGLAPAIRWYARSQLEAVGARVVLHLVEEPLSLDGEQTLALFRIAQEAIHNARRHAQAQTVTISLERDEDNVRLCIEDDGVGFEPDVLAQKPEVERLGLLGMQERAELVEGKVIVESEPGQGTNVLVSVPRRVIWEHHHEENPGLIGR
ncbi:MAG TPA: sensor histidine kinase [Candidatus Sulfomarinibacteraceae bacterium]|nr:sensor histidine kinase [Candidatus Sulfomarinibacteraceae bacterium]